MRVVVTNNSVARYPDGGGLFMWVAQYPLGLLALGHEVHWIEIYNVGRGTAERARRNGSIFLQRVATFGLAGRCDVAICPGQLGEPVNFEDCEWMTWKPTDARAVIRDADVAWNIAGSLRGSLLHEFRRRALIEVDPGVWQLGAESHDMGLDDYDAYLTVGSKVGDADCQVPTLNRVWHRFAPVVYLPMWTPAEPAGVDAPFTTV